MKNPLFRACCFIPLLVYGTPMIAADTIAAKASYESKYDIGKKALESDLALTVYEYHFQKNSTLKTHVPISPNPTVEMSSVAK